MITAGVWFIHAACRTFSTPSCTVGNVRELDRRAVAVSNDQWRELRTREQLVVGADLIRLAVSIEASLGLIHAGGNERAAQVLHVQAVGAPSRSDSPEPEPPVSVRR